MYTALNFLFPTSQLTGSRCCPSARFQILGNQTEVSFHMEKSLKELEHYLGLLKSCSI